MKPNQLQHFTIGFLFQPFIHPNKNLWNREFHHFFQHVWWVSPFFDGKTRPFFHGNTPPFHLRQRCWLRGRLERLGRSIGPRWGFMVGFHPTNGDFMEISSTSDGDFNLIWGCPKIGIELQHRDFVFFEFGIELFFFNFHRCTKIVGHPTFLLYPTKTLRLRLCLAEFRQHGSHCKLLWGVFSFGWFWRGAAHIEGDVSRVSHSCWFFLHKSLGSPHSYWTYQPSVFWLWSSNSELLLVQLLQFHHFRPCVGQIEKHVDCWA